jgi:hypothetical protein
MDATIKLKVEKSHRKYRVAEFSCLFKRNRINAAAPPARFITVPAAMMVRHAPLDVTWFLAIEAVVVETAWTGIPSKTAAPAWPMISCDTFTSTQANIEIAISVGISISNRLSSLFIVALQN